MSAPRLAILPDYSQERWPSMDLCSEMLGRGLSQRADLRAETLHPPYRSMWAAVPMLGRAGASRNADRLVNRMRTYPIFLKRTASKFDCFHVVDHSYSHLLHEVPYGAAGVFCHDLDTFRCLLNPAAEPRPRWFKAMARRVLDGFRKAAIVFHTTAAVRRQLVRHGLVDERILVQAPLGIAEEFHEGEKLTVPVPAILHVGSCIPRKRIDVLLDVFAELRRKTPEIRLIQAGGQFTAVQRAQIDRLAVGDAIDQRNNLSRSELADLYRTASAVLVTSEAEGFGLPVVEAMACGAIVVASDIEPLREVGGDAAVYCPVGDVAVWSQTMANILVSPSSAPSQDIRLARAREFSWQRHADIIGDTYLQLCGEKS